MAQEKPLALDAPRDGDGEKPLRVRRGRVASVDLYEIKDSELDRFEKGGPGDLELNFAIFLLSTAFASVCTLVSATFKNLIIGNAFLFVAIIGFLLGAFLILSWWRTRSSVKVLCAQIRERMQADPEPGATPIAEGAPPVPEESDDADPDAEPDELPPPVG